MFICDICRGLVYEPRKCDACEQVYCHQEITNWAKTNQNCPHCKKSDATYITLSTRLERNTYNETEVDGCTIKNCEKKNCKMTLE